MTRRWPIPGGAAVTGWADSSKTLQSAAGRIAHDRRTAFGIRARFVPDDLACCHEIQRGEAMPGGSPSLSRPGSG